METLLRVRESKFELISSYQINLIIMRLEMGVDHSGSDISGALPHVVFLEAGENIIRIYEREANSPSVQFEIFILTDVPVEDYMPTDEDALQVLNLTGINNFMLH